MEFIEISAKNVDDAITQATVQLGITSDQLEYEVLDKGSTGFLGIGSKNAVIKARKKFSIDENVVEFLSSIFDAMKMEVEILVAVNEEEHIIEGELQGDDMGILIGKRGQTLDSLQYLTSLVVNKGKASYVRVKLDTEDYRSRRKATLENLAKNIAMKVKKTRRPVFLEPMNPYERRIIHSALQNDPYVTTHSEGDEPNRRVVVTPKKGRSEGRPQERSGYRQRRPRPEGSYRTRREHEAFPQPQETAPAETQAEAPQE